MVNMMESSLAETMVSTPQQPNLYDPMVSTPPFLTYSLLHICIYRIQLRHSKDLRSTRCVATYPGAYLHPVRYCRQAGILAGHTTHGAGLVSCGPNHRSAFKCQSTSDPSFGSFPSQGPEFRPGSLRKAEAQNRERKRTKPGSCLPQRECIAGKSMSTKLLHSSHVQSVSFNLVYCLLLSF